MAEKKEDLSIISYIFGIVSIVLAFFTPMAGLVFGIISFVQSKKQNSELAKRAKKLSIIGIILSIIIIIIALIVSYYAIKLQGLDNFPTNFPIK